MEPSALKNLVSKINILLHLTKKATAEQHELKGHTRLNRGSAWHLRERRLPLGVDTCLFRRLLLAVGKYLVQRILQSPLLLKSFLLSAGTDTLRWGG